MAVTRATKHGITAGALALVVGAMAGCRGDQSDKPPRQFFPDMDDQPKYKAQARSTFFKDYKEEAHPATHVRKDWREADEFGRTMRQPVEGTVAFGVAPHAAVSGGSIINTTFMGVDFAERDSLLATDEAVYSGTDGFMTAADGSTSLDEQGNPIPKYLATIPIPVDEKLLQVGQEQYNIYCIVCHGGTGHGDGLVGRRWSYPLPNYHDLKYQRIDPATGRAGEKGQDGYIFHVIRKGVPNPGGTYEYKMRPYATKLTVQESWAVVAYIRSLQKSEAAPLSVVPDAERLRLNSMRGQSPPPPSAPAPAAAPATAPTPAPAVPAPAEPAKKEGEL